MAIAARLSLHIMYEFTAFMNMWAVQVLKVSGGVAAQVSAVLFLLCKGSMTNCVPCMVATFMNVGAVVVLKVSEGVAAQVIAVFLSQKGQTSRTCAAEQHKHCSRNISQQQLLTSCRVASFRGPVLELHLEQLCL